MASFLAQQVDKSHPDFTLQFVLENLGPTQLGADGISGVKNASFEHLETGGFISDLYRVSIEFNDAQREPYKCIFKVPTTRLIDLAVKYDEETYKELVEWTVLVHNAECRFYAEVAPLLLSAPVPLPFRLAKMFASRQCPNRECVPGGFLLIEDLCATSPQPIGQVGLAEGLSDAQAESAIIALAQYHAICLWLSPALVNSFRLEANLDFQDEKLHILDRLMAMPDGLEKFGPKRQELAQLYSQWGCIAADQHKQFGIAPVIVHGDYWCNNLFYECRDGSIGAAGDKLDAVIDFQVVYTGTGINDLIRIIFVCVDGPIRRANMAKWLGLYSDQVGATLTKLGLHEDEGKQRPLDLVRLMTDFHKAYELCFQLFLTTNVLSGEKDPAKRQKLLNRMADLFEDYQNGSLF